MNGFALHVKGTSKASTKTNLLCCLGISSATHLGVCLREGILPMFVIWETLFRWLYNEGFSLCCPWPIIHWLPPPGNEEVAAWRNHFPKLSLFAAKLYPSHVSQCYSLGLLLWQTNCSWVSVAKQLVSLGSHKNFLVSAVTDLPTQESCVSIVLGAVKILAATAASFE